jgi:nitroimidazol reductase NimA-like FMN-containing flavoprotein (pyridoxamine 5'-phosphate oxidase superfamily)
MGSMPETVERLLEKALVSEVTVVGGRGGAVTHPLIPLYDGEHIYVTSSVLFSKKLEHIKRNPKVAVSISDPVGAGGDAARCTIQGDARLFEEDPHETWERILPLWRAKEPAIEEFLGKRYALPLFFERTLVEITPRRAYWWDDGNTSAAPQMLRIGASEEAAR